MENSLPKHTAQILIQFNSIAFINYLDFFANSIETEVENEKAFDYSKNYLISIFVLNNSQVILKH
jgi:hypothetical protein